MFAGVVRRGDHLGVRIDPALPDRAPLPRADIRQRMVPLGPGRRLRCQQLPARLLHRRRRHRLRARRRLPGRRQGPPRPPGHRHPRRPRHHPRRREVRPARRHVLLRPRSGIEIGQELVADPRIKAVGFTGSRGGGPRPRRAPPPRATVPIPVYAEMSSINPVVVLPGALAERRATRSPGVRRPPDARRPASSAPTPACSSSRPARHGDAFLRAAGAGRAAQPPASRCSPPASPTPTRSGTAGAARHRRRPRRRRGRRGRRARPGATRFVTRSPSPRADAGAAPTRSSAPPASWSATTTSTTCSPRLERARGPAHRDRPRHRRRRRGRAARCCPSSSSRSAAILFNGWPTGVEVGHAMVHGGPFPATSDSRTHQRRQPRHRALPASGRLPGRARRAAARRRSATTTRGA